MKTFLDTYLKKRPLFLSLIRAKEASLFQKYLPLKRPVLDLGCGDGFFAQVAFKKIDFGLDVTESRITEVPSGIYDKIVTYDGHKIPFESASIQTVVSNCVLEHIPNLDEVLKETCRVLKPSGLFITSVMAKPWEENLFGSLLLGNSYKAWMKYKQVHFNLYTSQQWTKAFGQAGFKVKLATGYLSPNACKLIDLCHYLSLPSLVSYKLFGRWNLFNNNIIPLDFLVKTLTPNVQTSTSGAIFFVLQKY